MSKSKRGLFFCYSPRLSEFIQSKGIRSVGVGNNVNNGRTFWQYERGDELDEVISEWQASNPNKA